MTYFSYVAKDKTGRTVKGQEVAGSEHELIMRLVRKGLVIVSIKETSRDKLAINRRGKPIKLFDMMVLCKQVATMLKGGVPLVRALEIMAAETHHKTLKASLAGISQSIRDGDSFSMSLKKMSNIFSPLFIAVAEAGEKVGALDVMLERLSVYFAARDRLNKKIVSAVTYPVIIIVFFAGAMLFVTLFLIPKFKGLYSSFGANLPSFTLMVFGISDFVIRNILFIVLAVTAGGVFFTRWVRTKKGRYAFDNFVIKIPVFGEIMKKAGISKFARTLSTLLEEGIPVPESLDLVSRTTGNAVIERAGLRVSKMILDGEKIPDAFKKAEIFPTVLVQMATVGVESGNLPALLDKTADFYEDEVDSFVGIMASLIEPVIIIVLGLFLGAVIIALYLPVFKLGSAISGMK